MNMGKPFELTIGTFEDNATLAYLDLCGIRSFYKKSVSTKAQARIIYTALLEIFSEKYFDVFKDGDKDLFNINIYADSIMICQRLKAERSVERLIEFLLSYQLALIQKNLPTPENNRILSRALVVRDSFFYLNVKSATSNSILNSEHTHISLCGGRGLVSVDEMLKGLPAGVYVSKNLVGELSNEQQRRRLKVKDDKYFFIKQDEQITIDLLFSILNDKTINELILEEITNLTEGYIERILKKSGYENEAVKKLVPWFSANLGKRAIIERETACKK